MPIYNKLVRDHIPDMLRLSGKGYQAEELSDEKYKEEAQKKLQEELNEYLSAETDEDALNELADILELLHALSNQHGASPEKLEEIRKEKARVRGGFDEKRFLVMVEDKK
ncbi:nucleoside triphosphate pyrophosphohydrolase [Bacillus sp. FJAT-44742]|uniref:nucleoside triphosphate pyrophosphohydrolase n=1 Tax=Bacillus sp. FJAT-44742 TaxID=2014005 RepID=UPI000C237F77|nr:nucleoside triphosphate pyrophosphohydrolase [Bacillus sp. FJAT-44742]